jgi:hypothetical protein
MSEYAGHQSVGIDPHRRRTVLVRTADAGEELESVRMPNDVESVNRVFARAGVDPEVVLEATTAGTRPLTPSKRRAPRCLWRTNWWSRRSSIGASRSDDRDAKDLADLFIGL